MQPLFSIIIAVRNAASTIEAALQSVLRQTETAHEIIVIDAVSTDGTLAVLERYRSQLGYLVSEPDRGIPDAWNKAIAKARGEWLYFLGADDQLANVNVLAQVRERLSQLPTEAMIAYGQVEMIDTDMGNVRAGAPWAQLAKRFHYMTNLPHQGVFHRRRLFETVGCFDLSFRIVADYELLHRHITKQPPTYMGDLLVAHCKVGGLSTSYEYRTQVLNECRRANLKLRGHDHFSWGWHVQRMKASLLAAGFKLGIGPALLWLNKWKRTLILGTHD